MVIGFNSAVFAVCDVQDRVAVLYNATAAMAKPAQPAKPAKPSQLINDKPLMYPNAKNGYRTGFSKPKTRFAHPNKRFSKPQRRFSHKRPEYIYTKEYQNNITNRHNPGMKKYNSSPQKQIAAANNKNINTNKVVVCDGIIYYGIKNNCK